MHQVGILHHGCQGRHATQSIVAGDTVTIGGNYNAVTFNAAAFLILQAVEVLNTNETVENTKGVIYKYIGALAGVDIANADYSDATKWVRLASAGDVYTYIGPVNTNINLNNQDYSDTRVWLPANTSIPASYLTTGVKAAPATPQLINLTSGDSTVVVVATITAPDFKSSQGSQTVAVGKIVQAADGTLYQSLTLGSPINLSTTDFSNTQLWTRVPSPGDVYRYVGTSGSVDINNQDYSTANWQRVLPSSLTAIHQRCG